MLVILQTVVVKSGGHNPWILKSRDVMLSLSMIVKTVTMLGLCSYMVRSYSTVPLYKHKGKTLRQVGKQL